MQQEGDPSVEEILESIKKVIARDNREIAQSQRKVRATRGVVEREPAEQDIEDDEVLDLGDAATALLDDDQTDEGQHDRGQFEQAPFAADHLHEDECAPDCSESLTSRKSDDEVRQSLSALSMLVGPKAKPRGPLPGESSLESMVREMIRPMLSEWLDENLPVIVERLVRDEIDRIAGKKR